MKKTFFFASMLCLPFVVFSQNERSESFRKVRFGFNLGINRSELQSYQTPSVNSRISNGIGGSVGILMDYSVSKRIVFSPKMELSYHDSQVEILYIGGPVRYYDVFPVCLEIMTHGVYKLGNGKNKPYFLFGPNLRIPFHDNSKTTLNLTTKPDLALDFGLGCETKVPFFIFAPELRFSLGLLDAGRNSLQPDLNFNTISLVFNFK